MANFESSITSKKFSGPKMKEFDIPDESDFHASDDPQLHNAIRRRAMPSIDVNAMEEFQARINGSQQDPADLEREIAAAREAKEAKRTGRERLSDGARRRIEMLVGMTRGSRSADLDGNVFILQTLKSKEMREAITAAAEFDGTVQSPFEIRRQLLARSLTQVADVDIEQFIGSVSLEAKLEFIDELGESLLNRLYDEYLIMVKETREKYAVKDIDAAKEIAEDLKK